MLPRGAPGGDLGRQVSGVVRGEIIGPRAPRQFPEGSPRLGQLPFCGFGDSTAFCGRINGAGVAVRRMHRVLTRRAKKHDLVCGEKQGAGWL